MASGHRHAGPRPATGPGIWLYCGGGRAVRLGRPPRPRSALPPSTGWSSLPGGTAVVAASLEAAIPDAAALVFACLGVALALHGRHAVRARLLNAASAGTSVFMNVIAAAPGWRDVAVWVMPPAAYALASDSADRRNPYLDGHRPAPGCRHPGSPAGDEVTHAGGGSAACCLVAVAAVRVRWLSTPLAGFRAWVLEECPVAPRPPCAVPPRAPPALPRVAPRAVPCPDEAIERMPWDAPPAAAGEPRVRRPDQDGPVPGAGRRPARAAGRRSPFRSGVADLRRHRARRPA